MPTSDCFSGSIPISFTGLTTDIPRNENWIVPTTSTVGVMASMCFPAGEAAIRPIIDSGFSVNPLNRSVSTRTSDRMPWSRSLSLVLNPLITLLTTIRVATPSMTLTMQMTAR